LAVGTKVKIKFKKEDICGTVRHCRQDQFGYAVGIEFDARPA
jgi:hypothetical protein